MEFTSLLKNPLFSLEKSLDFKLTLPGSIDEVAAFVKRIAAAGILCVDTETTSLNPRQARLVGVSMAIDTKEAMYVPVGHKPDNGRGNLPLSDVLSCLKPVLESKEIRKIGQNLKYDYQVSRTAALP